MGRHKNQPRNTKWGDVQINHRIRNGRTYKLPTGYEMGRHKNQPRDTKWADVEFNERRNNI